MIDGETFLSACTIIAIGILCVSFLLTAYRAVRGPTLPDRVLALDMLVAIAIGFIAVLGIRTDSSYHVDIAIALGLVGFLATAAFARFVMTRGPQAADPDPDWELRRMEEADGP